MPSAVRVLLFANPETATVDARLCNRPILHAVASALQSATRETEPGRESPHRQSVDDDTCGRIPTGAEVSVADGEPDETPQTS